MMASWLPKMPRIFIMSFILCQALIPWLQLAVGHGYRGPSRFKNALLNNDLRMMACVGLKYMQQPQCYMPKWRVALGSGRMEGICSWSVDRDY